MAITATSVTTETEQAMTESPIPEPGGLAGLLGTGDHKALGRLYIGFALLFGLLAFGLNGASAYDQVSSSSWPPAEAAFRLSALGRISMVFLFALPLFIGLATYMCPLQVGARTIAFPRAAAAAFWTWLTGAIVMLVAFGPGKGGIRATEAKMVDLSLLALGLVIAALLLATICVVTTIITLRTPGLTLDRVPFFSWSMLVAGGVWVLQLPVLAANLALIYVDHHYAAEQPLAFGISENQWPQLAWLFMQPAIFAVAIPAIGIASDAIVTLGRVRPSQRWLLLTGIGAFGAVSLGAWAQPYFVKGLFDTPFFIGASVAIGLPLFMVVGGWFGALVKGRPSGASPFGTGLVSGLLLLLAALAGALFVIKPLRLDELPEQGALVNTAKFVWYGPAWQIGLSGLVVLAATTAAIAGIFYWGPKITGRQLNDGLGKLVGLFVVLGAVAFSVPYFVIGFSNRWTSIGEQGTTDLLSWVSVGGAAAVVVALLLTGFALLVSLNGPAAPADPWGCGQTLEWATSSPPPKGNFGELAPVTSAEPLLDAAEAETGGAA
jgi:heme/copper-type cytochrome/quinol oxidase subunit 1